MGGCQYTRTKTNTAGGQHTIILMVVQVYTQQSLTQCQYGAKNTLHCPCADHKPQTSNSPVFQHLMSSMCWNLSDLLIPC